MEHTEERTEQNETSTDQGQGEGAKRKRRRRRGKRRPDGSPNAGADIDGPDGDESDDADGTDAVDDAANGGAPDQQEQSTDNPARKKKRRRKKKRGPQSDVGDASGETSGDDDDGDTEDEAVDTERPVAPRARPDRQPAERPSGTPGGDRAPQDRGAQDRPSRDRRQQTRPAQAAQPQGAAQPKQERKNSRDRRRDKEKREQERQQQMLGRIVKTELLRDDAMNEPLLPQPKQVATTVDAYVNQHKGWQREVLMRVREIIRAAGPDLEEDIKWSQPVYDFHGPVCYVKAFSDHINVGFWRGTELRDADSALIGDGMKMRHITLRAVNDLKRDVLEALVKQAVKLNREKGDPTLS